MATATTSERGGQSASEREHFDRLIERDGSVWWGSRTRSGRRRFELRARTIASLVPPDALVLEIGCGAAAFTLPLLAVMPGLRLVGVDISEKCLELARRDCAPYPHARFVMADAENLAATPALRENLGRFDAVIGNGSLHHLDERRILREARDLLRPGGLVLFFEPNMLNPQVALQKNVPAIRRAMGDSPTETAFFRWRLRRLLEELGYGAIKVEPFDFLHPWVPAALTGAGERLGALLARIPLVREFGGSLHIQAAKR